MGNLRWRISEGDSILTLATGEKWIVVDYWESAKHGPLVALTLCASLHSSRKTISVDVLHVLETLGFILWDEGGE